MKSAFKTLQSAPLAEYLENDDVQVLADFVQISYCFLTLWHDWREFLLLVQKFLSL